MTTTAQMFETLEALRARLRVRIGAAAGMANGDAILTDFLRGAQDHLYETCEWKHLRSFAEFEVTNPHVWYDLPEDCNHEEITGVWVKEGGLWIAMKEGISVSDRNYDIPGIPSRYDIHWNPAAPVGQWAVQMEIFPAPSQTRTIRIEYFRALGPFENDNDVASIPTGPLFLHALTNAKLHYRQPDGAQYAGQLDTLLTSLKSKNRRASVIRRSEPPTGDESYLYPPRYP